MRPPRIRIAASHGGPIVGVDVETACPQHGAVCALGIAVVQHGEVRHARHWLLDPRTRFDPRFTLIHRITPDMVAGRPHLSEAWLEVESFLAESIEAARAPSLIPGAVDDPEPMFVAHNASFDRLQIESALGRRLPFRLGCTVAMSRRAFPRLARHNLKTVSEHLAIDLNHHDALSDARACALIASRCIAAGSASR